MFATPSRGNYRTDLPDIWNGDSRYKPKKFATFKSQEIYGRHGIGELYKSVAAGLIALQQNM